MVRRNILKIMVFGKIVPGSLPKFLLPSSFVLKI